MKTAAIFCRVSGDKQGKEGTSLETQLEGDLKYCQEKGYDVRYRFSGVESGLVLDRPMLNELRELVRAGDIDVVVIYCLDRLSRDPTHGVILTQELEKHGVTLEAVTEDVDNSELGKLISYIRGFASKLEAEKIKERTNRGRKAKAKQGKIFTGGYAKIYGYEYIKIDVENGGRRVINTVEAKWVKQMYQWLVNDGLSTTAITDRLRALNIPTRRGNVWMRQTVLGILKNPAYTGRTFAFAKLGHRRYAKPKDEWIELPGVTPAIITHELFEAGQKQLQANKVKATRNVKREYLLRGYIRCRQCGQRYWGSMSSIKQNGEYIRTRRYRCGGTQKMLSPVNQCHNRTWPADKLEAMVWVELQDYLSDRDLIIYEIENQRQDANQLGVLETELERIERYIKAVDREQHQLLRWALKDFPDDQVETENRRLNKARATLKSEKVEIEARVKASQDTAISLPMLETFVERMQGKLSTLDFEGKRQVLEMLGITIWIDGQTVEAIGTIDPECAIVTAQPD